MLVQESAKVKEKVTNKFDKEGMGSKNYCFWFPKSTWQWKIYLVKSRCKYKARLVMNHHGDSVQGETVFKFPLINEQGRNNIVSSRTTCFSTNSSDLQHEGINESKIRLQPFEILNLVDLSQLSCPSFFTSKSFNHSSSTWMDYGPL